MVRQIHERIESNLSDIQAVMNLLIGLTTIAMGLLMGLVMGLLIGVLRMVRNVMLLKQCVDLVKTRAIDSVRKGSQAFNHSEVVSGEFEF